MARTISVQAVIDWIRLRLQGSAPATPAAGYGYLYSKTADKHLYWKDEAGTETDLMDITAASTTTVTGKTINLTSNTLTGTTAQFNTALSDGDFATLAGSETLTNKTIAAPIITGAITLPDNVTQTFNPGADNAGLNVGSIAGDPATPDNGDVWYDSTANELTARINGASVALGVGGVSFGTVAVSGQSDVVAESASDTLNLAAGTNVTITTTPGTDTVTFAASGGNAFGTIAVSGQSDVVADAAPDTLTIAAGSGISLTTTPGTDTVTIANTGGTFTLNTNTTPVGNVGTGEDDLITYSVAANTLSTNSQFVHFVMGGTFAASVNAKRIRVKFGTTTLFDTGALAITAAGDWNIEGYIIRTGASAERCQVEFTSNETALAGSADYVDAVEDLTTSLTLKATGEATDNDDIIQKFLIVEKGGGSGAVTGPASSTDNAVARWDGTAGTVVQDSVITIGDTGIIAFPDNIRQTFNPGADAAGLNVGAVAGDPGTPSNGDLWYDSTANELTARINGANVSLGAGSTVGTDAIWDAKGDLAAGTGANTASRLAVGTNGYTLVANSAEATGLKWVEYLDPYGIHHRLTTADADDDEFSTNTIGSYTELDVTGTTTWTIANHVLSCVYSGQTAGDVGVLLKAMTLADGEYFETFMMGTGANANYSLMGIVITDGTVSTSNAIVGHVYKVVNGATIGLRKGTLTNLTTVISEVSYGLETFAGVRVRLKRVSSTSFSFELSTPDGAQFSAVGVSAGDPGFTPTHAGLFVSKYGEAGTSMAAFEYIRVGS